MLSKVYECVASCALSLFIGLSVILRNEDKNGPQLPKLIHFHLFRINRNDLKFNEYFQFVFAFSFAFFLNCSNLQIHKPFKLHNIFIPCSILALHLDWKSMNQLNTYKNRYRNWVTQHFMSVKTHFAYIMPLSYGMLDCCCFLIFLIQVMQQLAMQ